jgi:hypothetical protein
VFIWVRSHCTDHGAWCTSLGRCGTAANVIAGVQSRLSSDAALIGGHVFGYYDDTMKWVVLVKESVLKIIVYYI